MANRNESIMSAILNPHRFSVSGGGDTPAFGGASRNFDGTNDYINSANDVFKKESDEAFSVAFWVKGSDILTSVLGTWDSGASKGWTMGRRSSLGVVQGGFVNRTGSGGRLARGSTTIPENGTWLHLVMTYDGSASWSGFSFYNDGSAETVSPIADASDTYADENDLIIGEWGGNFLNGNLADLRFYDKELTSAEVSSIYSGTHVSDGLVGWWLLDSDDTNDYSGNGYDATNNGSTYSTDGPLD